MMSVLETRALNGLAKYGLPTLGTCQKFVLEIGDHIIFITDTLVKEFLAGKNGGLTVRGLGTIK